MLRWLLMDFLANYGLFLAKLTSLLLAIAVLLFIFFGLFFGLIAHTKNKAKGKLDVHKLNDKYKSYHRTLSIAIKGKYELKRFLKSQKKKKKKPNTSEAKKRIFVLDFQGDIRASAVCALREEITALLTTATHDDEVLLRLESGGGVVHGYGLAASQLQRIKDAHIKLVIAIDKVAASGGYLMACVADRIIAAPFAIVGSIGVFVQLPNFHRYLRKKYIDFEQIMAGDYKRTLTLFGENTEKGRAKIKEEVEETHMLFKSFIKEHRQEVDVEQIATGEHWYASKALDLRLVDELKTSDDYLLAASQNYDLFEIQYKRKPPLAERVFHNASRAYQQLLNGLMN
ncbi:protease SohB [Coxiella endosymbiont of Ornithodoros maritimus]|uniref:protease SohB n=1 Tax=Coxiella endosymbiont of Ornithodoros maritimus TaxID=1656172 RepID=UPI0022648C05|nr:protease SohB [Coxiella endosymbiont of Ornithodoros maritimus]